MKMLLVTFAALGGAVLRLQALINARLGGSMNGPVWATAISLAIGTSGLFAYLLAQRMPFPTTAQAATVPAWAWAA